MKRRSELTDIDIAEEIVGAVKKLSCFKNPPCEPPKGKDVCERMNYLTFSKEKTTTAAQVVAKELLHLWKVGDSKISLLNIKTIQRRILELFGNYSFVKKKSWKAKGGYF